jgi:pyruvate formate lyase activating enzyme
MGKMNGIIFDIKRFALHDGPGIRTTVFFKGCPLNCWWCHNPESIRTLPEKIKVNPIGTFQQSCKQDKEIIGKKYTVSELMTEIVKDKIFYDESGGGVTFSGGEPLLQVNFLTEVLKSCKESGINTAIDTSGFVSANYFNKVYEFTDLFLFDLKLADDVLHKKFTGVSNSIILDNLKMLTEQGNKLIIRIPLIPGVTDTEKNLSDISSFLMKLKNIHEINLLPYNEIAESKYKRFNKPARLRNLKTQDEESLNRMIFYFSNLNTEVSLRG